MPPIAITILKRNALVALVFLLVVTVRQPFSGRFTLPWMVVLVAFVCSLVWASRPLIQRGRPISAAWLSLLLLPVMGFPILITASQLSRDWVERQYRAQGLELVPGCNLAAASRADIEIYQMNDRLEELTNRPSADPAQFNRLHQAMPIALERARILGDDCRKRGHRDSHLWKTNWVAIKQALAASEP